MQITERGYNGFASIREALDAHAAWLAGEIKNAKRLIIHDASLKGFDLSKLDLSEADLSGADLTGANLSEADLTRANLTGANCTKIIAHGTNFNGAELIRANCTGADLSSNKLKNTNMSYAILDHATVTDASLKATNLAGASLDKTDFSRSDLSFAYLPGSDLKTTIVKGTKFHGADLSNTDLRDLDLRGADLSFARLIQAKISGARLDYANMNHANLTEANLVGTRLPRADLREANLTRAQLQGADLSGTVLAEPINRDGPERPLPANVIPLRPLHRDVEAVIRHQNETALQLSEKPTVSLTDPLGLNAEKRQSLEKLIDLRVAESMANRELGVDALARAIAATTNHTMTHEERVLLRSEMRDGALDEQRLATAMKSGLYSHVQIELEAAQSRQPHLRQEVARGQQGSQDKLDFGPVFLDEDARKTIRTAVADGRVNASTIERLCETMEHEKLVALARDIQEEHDLAGRGVGREMGA